VGEKNVIANRRNLTGKMANGRKKGAEAWRETAHETNGYTIGYRRKKKYIPHTYRYS
jgi:hypothetical protein